MKVCIVGGGNIGSILLTDLAKLEDVEIRLLTGNKNRHTGSMTKLNNSGKVMTSANNILVFEDPIKAYDNVDKVFFTLPKNVLFSDKKKYINLLPNNIDVYFVPGSGGVELMADTFHEKNIQIVGFQRVHSIARIKNYGESVYELDRKKETSIAFFPNNIPWEKKESEKKFLESLIQMPIKLLDSYLNISLVPSNSILHTSRIYDLFYSSHKNDCFEEQIFFYRDWTDRASKVLLQADNELQNLCKTIDPKGLKDVVSLKVHYESQTIESMSSKIRSIESFKNILAPLIKSKRNCFLIEQSSRYFIEDFEYGLMFIYLLSEFVETPNETIRELIEWYSAFMQKKYESFLIYPLFKNIFNHQKPSASIIRDFYNFGK